VDIQILTHQGAQIAEVTGEPHSLKGMQMVLDLIGDLAFNHKVSRVLIDRSLIDESFFDLKSGFAGELAQKFTNYQMKLAVTGNFKLVESLAMKAYIHESNLGNTVHFTRDREKALAWLAG